MDSALPRCVVFSVLAILVGHWVDSDCQSCSSSEENNGRHCWTHRVPAESRETLDVDWFVDWIFLRQTVKHLLDSSGFPRVMQRMLSGADSVHDSPCIALGWTVSLNEALSSSCTFNIVRFSCLSLPRHFGILHHFCTILLGVMLVLRIHSLRALWGLQWESLIITGWQRHQGKLQHLREGIDRPQSTLHPRKVTKGYKRI